MPPNCSHHSHHHSMCTKCTKDPCIKSDDHNKNMTIGWIVQYGNGTFYDERIITALKLKYPNVSVEVIQIPRVDNSVSSGPTSLSTLLLLLEQSVVSLKNKQIKHIIMPPQSILLAPFIQGESPLTGQSINIRHIGINFYVLNSGTPEVFNAQTMLRFLDTDSSTDSSIYDYMSGTNPTALFIYEEGSGGEIVKDNLLALFAPSTNFIEVSITFSGGTYTSGVTDAITAYNALDSSSVSIVVHCPDVGNSGVYASTFASILGSNPAVINVGGNFYPESALLCDMFYGNSTYSPIPLQLNFPGFVITQPTPPNVEFAIGYYEILLYIASNGTYRGAFGTLKFINRTKVTYWITEGVVLADSLVPVISNLRGNPIWLSA